MADRSFEASPSRGTVRPMLERMGRTLTEKKQRAHFYQLLSSAFVSSEELCRSRRVLSVDNTLRDLHNTSDDTKAEFNYCFIIHSK